MLVSGIQCRESVYATVYMHMDSLFQILLPYWLSQGTEYSSLCYRLGPCLCLLYVHVNPKLLICLFPEGTILTPSSSHPQLGDGMLGTVCRLFWLSQLEGKCNWHPGGRGRGCCCTAQMVHTRTRAHARTTPYNELPPLLTGPMFMDSATFLI